MAINVNASETNPVPANNHAASMVDIPGSAHKLAFAGYRSHGPTEAALQDLLDTDTKRIRTGPSKPEGNNVESALYGWITVNVYLFAPGCWSPIIRFTQAFTTFIVTLFVPGRIASVASTRNGVCHTVPSDLPFIVTTARFFTSPKSIHTRVPRVNQACEVQANRECEDRWPQIQLTQFRLSRQAGIHPAETHS